MNYTRCSENLLTLLYQNWITYVVRSFDVVLQRALHLLAGFYNSQFHLLSLLSVTEILGHPSVPPATTHQ